MRSHGRTLFYGFLVWLAPFVVSICFHRLKLSWPALFESIMPVTVAFCTLLCWRWYARGGAAASPRKALAVGFAWLAVNWALDLPMFLWGPMKLSLVSYAGDIGVAYLIIPIVTAAASRGPETA